MDALRIGELLEARTTEGVERDRRTTDERAEAVLGEAEQAGDEGADRPVGDRRAGRMGARADDEIAALRAEVADLRQEARLADALLALDPHPDRLGADLATDLLEERDVLRATDERTLRAERREERRPTWPHRRRGSEPPEGLAAAPAEAHAGRIRGAAGAALDRRDRALAREDGLLRLPDRGLHLGGVTEAVVAVLLQRLRGDLGELDRDVAVGSDLARIRHRIRDVLEDDLRRRVGGEG